MATNFPSSLDSLTNPTSSDGLNSPDHAGQHANANDAIEALEAKVGVNGSAVTTSLDYKVTVLSPPGMIVQYAGSSAPTGWLLCDGSSVSAITYANLYAAIGTTYGAGSGGATFNVPNLKGRIPVGRDSAQTEFDVLGETGGAKTHTLSSTEMPSHTHTQNSHTHTQDSHNHSQNAHLHGGYPGVGTGEYLMRDNAYNTGYNSWVGGVYLAITWVGATGGATATNIATTATNQSTTATNQNTGGGGAHNNLQPYLVLNYIIKT